VFRAQRFRSAGDGGQRGRPQVGSANPTAVDSLAGRATKARVAATRYQQGVRERGAGERKGNLAAQSGADVAALRGQANAGRRFDGERKPFSNASIDETS
jgi:hypothetical protein